MRWDGIKSYLEFSCSAESLGSSEERGKNEKRNQGGLIGMGWDLLWVFCRHCSKGLFTGPSPSLLTELFTGL